MKICALLPISMPRTIYGSYYDLLMQSYELVKDSDTTVEIRDVPDGLKDPALMSFKGFRGMNEAEIVKAMLNAERDGFDGVSGACYFDCGVQMGNNLLSIPVVGAAESTMHMAAMMGHKFAVITSEPVWAPVMAKHLVQLGFGPFAVSKQPVRAVSAPLETMVGDLLNGRYDGIVDDFLTIGRECIADGAEVIIAGCGLISPIFPVKGIFDLQGVPILDPMAMALKTTETLTKLKSKGIKGLGKKYINNYSPKQRMSTNQFSRPESRFNIFSYVFIALFDNLTPVS